MVMGLPEFFLLALGPFLLSETTIQGPKATSSDAALALPGTTGCGGDETPFLGLGMSTALSTSASSKAALTGEDGR